jgi:Domain of unknown function (DUF4386)
MKLDREERNMPDQPNIRDAARMMRAAGLLYLVIIVLGLGNELLLRAPLLVPGDAEASARNLAESVLPVRLSIAADAIMATADIALAVLLFAIFAPVSVILAALAAAFRLSQTAVIAGNLLNQQSALNWALAQSEAGATADRLAYEAMQLHGFGYDLGLVFFGVGSVLIGVLVLRGRQFPQWLGRLIVAAGGVYLTGSFLRILWPDAVAVFAPAYLVAIVAETAFALSLLAAGRGGKRIAGVKSAVPT